MSARVSSRRVPSGVRGTANSSASRSAGDPNMSPRDESQVCPRGLRRTAAVATTAPGRTTRRYAGDTKALGIGAFRQRPSWRGAGLVPDERQLWAHHRHSLVGVELVDTVLPRTGDLGLQAGERQLPVRLTQLAGLLPGHRHETLLVDAHDLGAESSSGAVLGIEIEVVEPSRPWDALRAGGEDAVVRRGDDRVGVVELELDAVVREQQQRDDFVREVIAQRAEVDRIDVGVPQGSGVVDDDPLRAERPRIDRAQLGDVGAVQAEDQGRVVDRAKTLAQLLERTGLACRHRPRVVDDQLLVPVRSRPRRDDRFAFGGEGGDDGDSIARVRGQPQRADEAGEDGAGVVAERGDDVAPGHGALHVRPRKRLGEIG